MKARLGLNPIILYGCPRSGTTYLHYMLNAHPDVFVSRETRLFAWLHQTLNVLTEHDSYLLNYRSEFVEHLQAELPEVIRRFYEKMTMTARKRWRPRRSAVRYWGDKNPHYADSRNDGCLETVVQLFPEARFVHIVRDGRDVIASLLRRENDGRPWVDFERAHYVWITHVRRGRSFGLSQPPGHYLELRYEELIADDLASARSLFAFLDIDMHPAVEQFCEEQRRARTPFSEPTRDISAGVQGSDWLAILDEEQQARSLGLLGETLLDFGYIVH